MCRCRSSLNKLFVVPVEYISHGNKLGIMGFILKDNVGEATNVS